MTTSEQETERPAAELLMELRCQNLVECLELFQVDRHLGQLSSLESTSDVQQVLNRLSRFAKLLDIGFLCGALADDGRSVSALRSLDRALRLNPSKSSSLLSAFSETSHDQFGYHGTWFYRLVAIETRLSAPDLAVLANTLSGNTHADWLDLAAAAFSEERILATCGAIEEKGSSRERKNLLALEQFLFFTVDLSELLGKAPRTVWSLTLDLYQGYYQLPRLDLVMNSLRSAISNAGREPRSVPEIAAYETLQSWSRARALTGGRTEAESFASEQQIVSDLTQILRS